MAKQVATFGAGCFWGVEAILKSIDGVLDTETGYSGGNSEDPTYQEVCTGTSGHIEVVQLQFDPEKVSFKTLLNYFWRLHDPTQKDRQGPDVGTQYGSVIFYHSEEQKKEATESMAEAQPAFARPIATVLRPSVPFYPAEEHHQDYYDNNPGQVCHVLRPTLEQ